MTIHVAAYRRVSTDDQAIHGVSLPDQQQNLEQYVIQLARVKGWDSYELHWYTDDGYSAGSLKRPAMQQLITDIRADKIKMVIATWMDRITREMRDLAMFVSLLQEYDVDISCSRENIDINTLEGEAMTYVSGIFGQLERRKISKRVRDNMLTNARNGEVQSRPCFGYDVINKQLLVNENERPWAMKIIELHLQGVGPRGIAKYLNEHGVVTKQGSMWQDRMIRIWIRSHTIKGATSWNKTMRKGKKVVKVPPEQWIVVEDTHEALVDAETWDEMQRIMDGRKHMTPRNIASEYLLSGLVFCGHCGARMNGTILRNKPSKRTPNPPRRQIYLCHTYQKKGMCFYNWIDANELASVMQKALLEGIDDPAKLPAFELSDEDSLKKELDTTERAYERCESKFQKQIEAYEAGVFDIETLRKRKEDVANEKAELKQRMDKLLALINNQDEEAIRQRVIGRLNRYREALLSDDNTAKKLAFRQAIAKIEIFDKERVVPTIWA